MQHKFCHQNVTFPRLQGSLVIYRDAVIHIQARAHVHVLACGARVNETAISYTSRLFQMTENIILTISGA